jgi:DNA polymerase III epsilon subunit family exonuclease
VIAWDADVQPASEPAPVRPFDEIDFVIVDVETTGWSPGEARITEIGAVRVSAGQVRAWFSSLVNPHAAIPEQVAELTGISDAMVAAAPSLERVLPAFLDFADGCVLTAHNAPFDVGFLSAACVACDLSWPDFTVVDTVELARWVLGEDEVPNCKLSTLAAFFGARTLPRHRALADAMATADVLLGLMPRLAAAGVSTVADLRACQDVSRNARARPGRPPRGGVARAALGRWLRLRRRAGDRRAGDRRASSWAVRYRRWLGIGARGGRRGHRDRSGQSRRGAHPGDGGSDRPDSSGQ